MRKEILKLLDQIDDLPPFPEVLRKLQMMMNDPKSSISDIEKVIELDQVLAGSILKLANSAYYSAGVNTVDSLSTAINKLGLEKIKQLAYSLKLTGLFINTKILDYFSFWKHSLSVAIFTQKLSHYTKLPQKVMDIAYLSGLMHDVGIMVFCQLIPDKYEAFLSTLPDKEEPIEVLEKKDFDIDHQELGALFIEKRWKVDKEIVQAVRYHHFPFLGKEEDQQCAQLLNVANGICNNQGLSNGINCYHEVFKEGAWEKLGLSLSDTENIINDIKRSMEQALGVLHL